MSRLMFNCLIIVVCMMVSITTAIIIPAEFRKSVKRFHTSVQVIGILIAAALLVFMFFSLDYTGVPAITGEVAEIRVRGSFAGIYDRYEIILTDSDGNRHTFQSAFRVSGSSSDMMSGVEAGGYYEIYGSTYLDAFFYSIKPLKQTP